MAVKPKTISAVLMLVLTAQARGDSGGSIMAGQPAERLLRGSMEERRSPMETLHPLEQQERPNMFFNAEGKSVRMDEGDLVTDPVTGQTMIKHMIGNSETDYLMRPTDVALKSLQGYYVGEQPEFPSEAPEGTSTLNKDVAEEPSLENSRNSLKTAADATTEAAEFNTHFMTDGSMTSQIGEDFQEAQPLTESILYDNRKEQPTNTVEDRITVNDSTTTLSSADTAEPVNSGRSGDNAGDTIGRSLNDKVSVNPLSAIPKHMDPPRPVVPLSKRDTVRTWLQDPYLRAPVGLLVPLRSRSIERALAVWTDVSTPEGLNMTDVLVIGYDDKGIGWLSKHNLKNSDRATSVTGALKKLLRKYQNSKAGERGDAALLACAWASRRVPYDSALFVVTDSPPADADRLGTTLRAVIDKRLKLYTIWTDPLYSSESSERAVAELKLASKNTEGEFMDYHPLMAASNILEAAAVDDASVNGVASGRDVGKRTGRLDGEIGERQQAWQKLLVRRISGGGAAPLGVPVEVGVTALRVRVEGSIDRAALYPPSGIQIDLLNASSVLSFSAGSRQESESPLQATLLFATPQASHKDSKNPKSGLWRLSVRCRMSTRCEYRVVVTAQARLALDAALLDVETLRLRANGPIASIRESSLVDEYGTELAKIPFSYQPAATVDGVEPVLTEAMPTLGADVQLPLIRKSGKVYVKILGRDLMGEPFTRVAGPIFKSESRSVRSASIAFPGERDIEPTTKFSIPKRLEQRDYFPEASEDLEPTIEFPIDNRLERAQRESYNVTDIVGSTTTSQIFSQSGALLTAVQIGLSSRLYGAPGDNLQLHFEVTNYRDTNIYFRFQAAGNLNFLRSMRPTEQWINAGQTANVIVNVGITAGTQLGARDSITFSARGQETVTISAHVYVQSPELQLYDTWAPRMRHSFQGDCMFKQGGDCASHYWSVTVYARDNDGGLLRLSSSPAGLRYERGFTAGTREEVAATYRSTCCNTRLLLNAVDATGNANTYAIDAAYYIPDAAIAAIVLAIFLFIALVALIVITVMMCLRRRKESRQIPSYATSRRETS